MVKIILVPFWCIWVTNFFERNSLPRSKRTVEGFENTEAHEVLNTWTILAVFLSSIGAVVQNPVARSTRQAKNLCGGSCVQAGSLPEVSQATVELNSLLPCLITDCS